VEFASGARASLDLCMFAEGTLDNEHVVAVGDEGKLESFLPSGELRFGRREDFGRRAVWGEGDSAASTAGGVRVRQVRDTSIRYLGQHFGASYVEHLRFAQAVREGRPAEIPLAEGLRAAAIGLAAHKSIEQGRVVALSEVLNP
jgi:predicted dehydrogenase